MKLVLIAAVVIVVSVLLVGLMRAQRALGGDVVKSPDNAAAPGEGSAKQHSGPLEFTPSKPPADKK